MTRRVPSSAQVRGAHAQAHRWMVSYLDVLTILLIFFVTAAAASLHKVPTTAIVEKSKTTHPTMRDPSPREQKGTRLDDEALKDIERKLKEGGLDVRPLSEGENVETSAKGLAVTLPQSIVFAPGDDRVRAEAMRDLSNIADALAGIPNKVNLAGHADATPIHNRRFKNNWELAAARSLRLMEVLTERYGVDPSRVSISSYGALEPKSPNSTPTGRANNRRVEILIYAAR